VRRFQAVASNEVTATSNLVQGPFSGDARLLFLQGKKLAPGCFLRGLLSITAGLSIRFCGGLRPFLNIRKRKGRALKLPPEPEPWPDLWGIPSRGMRKP